MMNINQCKEQFSFAYIRAVAAAAGFSVAEPSVDDDSIDLQLASRSTSGTTKRPRLELQAKCLGEDKFDGTTFSYPLKRKNYDDLREPHVLVPRILVVVRVPANHTTWIDSSDDRLLIKHCGYWRSLRDQPDRDNTTSVAVRLPRNQRFDVAGLHRIMDRIGQGESP